MGSPLPDASYSLRNWGPWTVVSLDDWDQFEVGQSTAVELACDSGFQNPDRRLQFYSLLPVRSVHEADQVHGDGLFDVPAHSSGLLQCDGLTTARSGVMLTMRTADCYPVFIRDVDSHRFGLVHAGWRGLRDKIVLKALEEWFDGPVSVLVGAGIAPESYEVSGDVISEVARTHDVSTKALKARNILSDEHLDLPRLIRWQCRLSRRSINSFKVLGLSTGEHQPVPMYSYRETSTDERLISWIFKTSC
ncbi:MAG: polyphenol oxidase family protein [bacterium]